MFEVLEIIQRLLLLGGLFYFAWCDYRTKTIAVIPVCLMGIGGIVLHLMLGSGEIGKLLAGMAVGVFLLLISVLTAESIGVGDGLLFLVSGIYLEFLNNMTLFCGTIFLVGGYTGICLLLKRKKKEDRIAVAPFMLTAYVLFVL